MTENLKDIIKKEYLKCALDCEYFLRKYSYIQVPNKGRQLFELYDYQAEALHAFQDHRYNILLKGRQIGISTLVAGYALWRMLFKRDEQILVIAIKQDVAKNLVTKVKFMHQLLPVWLRGNLIEDNKLTLRFGNGSTIKATATRESAGRSEALSLLIIDEAAFIDGADEIDTDLNMIKGGGAALLREKIVASASREEIIIVSGQKYVKQLGEFPLPVEVIPFGWQVIFNQLETLGGSPDLRLQQGQPLRTDQGNFIIDCRFRHIIDAAQLEQRLNMLPGVVENGLFIGLCSRMILADGEKVIVKELKKK